MEHIKSSFIRNNRKKIIEEIKSDDFSWQGTSNGDNPTRFQGRKLKQLSLILLLVGEEMKQEERILTEEEKRDLFFKHIRHITDDLRGSTNTSRLDLHAISNLWKVI